MGTPWYGFFGYRKLWLKIQAVCARVKGILVSGSRL